MDKALPLAIGVKKNLLLGRNVGPMKRLVSGENDGGRRHDDILQVVAHGAAVRVKWPREGRNKPSVLRGCFFVAISVIEVPVRYAKLCARLRDRGQ